MLIAEVIDDIVTHYPTQESLLKHILIMHLGESVFEQVPLAHHNTVPACIRFEQRKITINYGDDKVATFDAMWIHRLFSKYTPNDKLIGWFNSTSYLNEINAKMNVGRIVSHDKMLKCLFIRGKLKTQEQLIENTQVRLCPLSMPDDIYELVEKPNYVFVVTCEEYLEFHFNIIEMTDLASYYRENSNLLSLLDQFK